MLFLQPDHGPGRAPDPGSSAAQSFAGGTCQYADGTLLTPCPQAAAVTVVTPGARGMTRDLCRGHAVALPLPRTAARG